MDGGLLAVEVGQPVGSWGPASLHGASPTCLGFFRPGDLATSVHIPGKPSRSYPNL